MKAQGWDHHINFNQMMLTKIFGSSETLFSFDTYQFEDYSKVVTSVDPEKKAKNTQRSVPAEIKE
ncbi:hypothetical protein [Clostridium beijerinckii]|uniref:hypothetical protein n=1 Tax=Clostridium beijerinckii TaxID=1520 RepID=UPI00157077CF|nr:hypothetical protein [Clostridium beijerinckii]